MRYWRAHGTPPPGGAREHTTKRQRRRAGRLYRNRDSRVSRAAESGKDSANRTCCVRVVGADSGAKSHGRVSGVVYPGSWVGLGREALTGVRPSARRARHRDSGQGVEVGKRRARPRGAFVAAFAAASIAVSCSAVDRIRPSEAIADVTASPGRYVGREVVISGVVTDALKIPFVAARAYTITQGNSSILVFTTREPPAVRQQVRIRGLVESAAVLGGRPYGLHVREIRRW